MRGGVGRVGRAGGNVKARLPRVLLRDFFELFTVVPDLQSSINVQFVLYPRLDDLFVHQ